jgi:uncharacterized protein
MVEQRFTMVSLGVRDLNRAVKFYENGLGWKRSGDSNESIIFFKMGGVLLGLYSWDGLAEDAKMAPEGTGFPGITIAHNARTKEEVDSILDTAKAAGAKILKPAEEVFWGGYSGYFADPDGHLWEVAFNPFWPLDEEGRPQLAD